MIILDNKPTPEATRPPVAGPSSSITPYIQAAPPAYTPPASPTTPLLLSSAPASKTNGWKAVKRFSIAFAVAALVCVLLLSFVSLVAGDIYRDWRWYNDHIWGNPVNIQPHAGDGEATTCNTNWYSHQSSASSQTVLSGSSRSTPGSAVHDPPQSHKYRAYYKLKTPDLLYIISRGAHASGIIHFVPAVDASEVTAEIEVNLFDERLKKLFRVCQLKRPDGSVGLGILTPSVRWWWLSPEQQTIPFTIAINVPTGSLSSSVHSIETHLPHFEHSFEHLGLKHFDSVTLKGTDKPINAQGILAREIRVDTMGAPIRGIFIAEHKIHLSTAGAPLDVVVYLDSEKAQMKNESVEMSLLNYDGPINAAVSLAPSLLIAFPQHPFTQTVSPPPSSYATDLPGSGGSFRIKAQTFNAPLTLSVPMIPVGANLSLSARTTNRPASVALNHAYEGYLHLSTTSDSQGGGEAPEPNIHVEPGVRGKDPYKEGRNYRLERTSVRKGEIKGYCTWGNPIRKFASNLVEIETGGAPSSLTII